MHEQNPFILLLHILLRSNGCRTDDPLHHEIPMGEKYVEAFSIRLRSSIGKEIVGLHTFFRYLEYSRFGPPARVRRTVGRGARMIGVSHLICIERKTRLQTMSTSWARLTNIAATCMRRNVGMAFVTLA